MSNLVIVESPAKAKTIGKFLGSEYVIQASMGHVRDLPEKRLGFDPENDFEAEYEISPDKKKIITNLKKYIKKDTVIWLATDEDREGEAISWHLISALKIEKNPIKRIAFHEITKSAILNAIKNPREIDQNLVDAQQARRILDRAVGYELSPLLWKKIKGGLSAGRVQSVAVRFIVEREREIRAFISEEFWKIKANFIDPEFQAELSRINGKQIKVENENEAKKIERSAKKGDFIIDDIIEKEGTRKPPAPFTTSTLQQEAARKLGYSVKQTMMLAQQLYEGNVDIPGFSGGLITYMRTDSVNLSNQAINQAKEVIKKEFGEDYSETRQYKTKSKGAQEAHEAIRPTDLSLKPSDIKNNIKDQQFKLYDLIWKRTLATQMKDAKVQNTTIKIEAGEKKELEFEAKGLTILFPGFMRAYQEGSDDPDQVLSHTEKILPFLEKKQVLNLSALNLEQNFTKPPARYTEASLVKKLESEGIGRPSTYAPTISTIQSRGYVEKTQDKKLQPTDIGEIVNDFLVKHFSDIVDYSFTAKMEDDLDNIANGKQEWKFVIRNFYNPFHMIVVEKSDTVKKEEASPSRDLGTDPSTGKLVSVRIGKYGPIAQMGTKNDHEKPRFASIPKGRSIIDITLEEALSFFKLPRVLGKDKNGEEIVVNIGKFGPYVKIMKEFYSIKGEDPYSIEIDKALEIIEAGKEIKKKKVINTFDDDIQVLNGPYGPYIKKGKKNYRIPKTMNAENMTFEDCKKIIDYKVKKRK